jgi:hypothetical protein
MMTDALVRNMNDEDAEQVIALWKASGITRPWNNPVTDIAFARRGEHSTVLVADLTGRGVWKVQLLVREDNQSIKGFYEHLGYTDVRSSCFQKIIRKAGAQ